MTSTESDDPDAPKALRTKRAANNATPTGPTNDTAGSTGRVTAAQAMRGAAVQLAELLGTTPDSVSALRPTQDGWTADVEVVELVRVPDTMTVMATYRVTLDLRGQLLGYERVRRYARGQLDRER
ncbi:gas vesicle protein GvpO [Streptomyces sp. NBC_00286]|uniref:gas vesicle protein GvpO n=1 Tax=Streptomyces sp. NBC_00286 TaxID=2975701 RepID=UPI002E2E19F5|nr:gas vesicle protein [Streptomyces sp. NBC_00286]